MVLCDVLQCVPELILIQFILGLGLFFHILKLTLAFAFSVLVAKATYFDLIVEMIDVH